MNVLFVFCYAKFAFFNYWIIVKLFKLNNKCETNLLMWNQLGLRTKPYTVSCKSIWTLHQRICLLLSSTNFIPSSIICYKLNFKYWPTKKQNFSSTAVYSGRSYRYGKAICLPIRKSQLLMLPSVCLGTLWSQSKHCVQIENLINFILNLLAWGLFAQNYFEIYSVFFSIIFRIFNNILYRDTLLFRFLSISQFKLKLLILIGKLIRYISMPLLSQWKYEILAFLLLTKVWLN